MFLKYAPVTEYLTAGTAIPDSYDGLSYSSDPRSANIAELAGVTLVSQYLESFKFRTASVQHVTDDCCRLIQKKAVELDEADTDNGLLDAYSEIYPSLNNTMRAFIELGYVKNVSKPGFIKPDADSIKYFIRQYNGVLIETKLVDSVYNAYSYDIAKYTKTISDNFTKCFIAFAYDATYVYLQNSLGINAGSLGFHRVTWENLISITIKGAVFHLTNPA